MYKSWGQKGNMDVDSMEIFMTAFGSLTSTPHYINTVKVLQ